MTTRTSIMSTHKGTQLAIVAALLAFALAGWLGRDALRQLLQGYLVAWLFCLAVPLGSMTLACIHALTGGRWGRAMAAEWQAGTAALPAVGVLWLPLLLGAPGLLPWAAAWHEPARTLPHWYLNLPFLYVRSAVCFALWLGIAWRQRRWYENPRPVGQPLAEQGFAGVSLLVLLITISLTGVDWVMSLVPAWHSTALGLLLLTCFITIALALAITMQVVRAPRTVPAEAQALQLRRDFGNLLLACVLGWGYLAFMDYLTAWIADQPAETVWYLPRMQWPWVLLPMALLALHLAVPLATLLPRRGKQSLRVLGAMAALVLVMQFVNMAWLVLPGLRDAAAPMAASDPLAWLGVGLCMMLAWRARHRPRAAVASGEEIA